MKPFSWSWSKWSGFDICPKRHYEVDLAKNFADSTEQLDWGTQVHAVMATACRNNSPLPPGMEPWQKWVELYADPSAEGTLYLEQKYALTRAFQPCSYFAPNVWYRGVCDLARINGPVARAVDWKTGKIKHDSRQLMLMAQCIFSHHPQVQRVKTEFVWLKEDAVTPEIFDRDTIVREWPPLLEGVKAMELAATTLSYPPKPNGLCVRNCPVLACPYHGKRPNG